MIDMKTSDRLSIVCLNAWGGMAGAPLLSFFEQHQDVDIFCLQEVYNGGHGVAPKHAAGRSLASVEHGLLEKIKTALPNHVAYFCPQYVEYFGVAIFVRNDLKVLDQGSTCIYREPGYVSATDIADHARMLQFVTLETERGPITVLNVHAAWQRNGKGDSPERLEQSRRILELTESWTQPLVLCGDFNLLPDTKSIGLLEEAGWKNLIRAHGITSTRTRLYDKQDRFADYIFVKNHIQALDFRILPDEVSDHAPLYVECEVDQ